jgi:hypothetical protein
MDLVVAIEMRDAGDGKRVGRVHILRELAERAQIQFNTHTMDGKVDPLTRLHHVIPLAKFLPVGAKPAAAAPSAAAPAAKAQLWAGMGVTAPVVQAEDVTDPQFFMVSFTVVNDGDETVNPRVDSSQFFVNGKELQDWGFIVGNGPKGDNFKALPPGECLQFGYAMGKHFAEPGIYKVKWKGAAFESPEVVFRVLPTKAR